MDLARVAVTGLKVIAIYRYHTLVVGVNQNKFVVYINF